MAQTQIAIALLFSVFVICLVASIPVTFSLIFATAATMIYLGVPLMTLVQQMAKSVNSFSLMAIPFFILAGEIMGAGGISNRIFALADVLVGRFPGGMALVNCLASMLFGGISGSAVADVSSLGLLEIPLMTKAGYDKDFSIALTVTTSCQGVLIPPSHNLIFYAMAAGGVSVANLFLAGMIPGIMLGLALMCYSVVIAIIHKYPRGKKFSSQETIRIFREGILAMMTAVIILGGVVTGIFTATESAAIACVYAFLISFFIYKTLTWKMMPRILGNVVKTLALTYCLIAGAGAFGWLMSYLQVPGTIAKWLISISANRIVVLLLINVMLLFLGCIMDMAPLIMICTPILLPAVLELGLTTVQFGVVLIFNLAIGLCTPPVGSALFVGCAVGKRSIEQVTKAIWPMWLIMIGVLMLITFVPFFTGFLPGILG